MAAFLKMSKVLFFLLLSLTVFTLFPQYLRAEATYRSTYYDSGALLSKTPYVNGKKHGVKKIYNADGKVIEEQHYNNDKLEKRIIIDHKKFLELGSLNFLKSWGFWLIIITLLGGVWFFLSKVLLAKKPF